jgi:hypothetical protein
MRNPTIADAIKSEAEKLPEAYVRKRETTAATDAPPPRGDQVIEPDRHDGATAPADSRAAVTKAGDTFSAELNASAPAHMIAESKDVHFYDPPQRPQRPFARDYYGRDASTDAQGRLLRDIEGRPLRTEFIAGRRFYGEPDKPLSPEDIKHAMERLDIRFAAVDPTTLEPGTAGSYSSTNLRRRPTGDILVSNGYSPSDQDLLTAHEFGHAVDHLAGRLSDMLTASEMNELRRVYGTLRSGSEGIFFRHQPENFGYRGPNVNTELVAEGIRAYMANPNYFKTAAPKTATKIRAAVNDSPYLKRVIQFNSLGAAGLIGAGVGSQSRDNQ